MDSQGSMLFFSNGFNNWIYASNCSTIIQPSVYIFMKAYSIIYFSLLITLLFGCVEDQGELKKGDAQVLLNVASRGSYQYVIQFEDKLYYPKALPETFKEIGQHPIEVSITFKLTGAQKDLFKPAPNDIPVLDQSIPEIEIIEIEKKN